MTTATIMYYFFIAVATIATVALLFVRHVFYGALLLAVVLLSLAGLYVLAFAEFLAIAQILVYAGGILVLMLFAIMLTSNLHGGPMVVEHTNRFAGILAGLGLMIILFYLLADGFTIPNGMPGRPISISALGTALLTDYALSFEITGVVLLIALIGASVIAASASAKRP